MKQILIVEDDNYWVHHGWFCCDRIYFNITIRCFYCNGRAGLVTEKSKYEKIATYLLFLFHQVLTIHRK